MRAAWILDNNGKKLGLSKYLIEAEAHVGAHSNEDSALEARGSIVKNISGTCRSVETQDSTPTGTVLARRSSQED